MNVAFREQEKFLLYFGVTRNGKIPARCISNNDTECVKDLNYRIEMIIFGSIQTTYELSIIFGGSRGSIENWLEPKLNQYQEIQLAQIHEIL